MLQEISQEIRKEIRQEIFVRSSTAVESIETRL